MIGNMKFKNYFVFILLFLCQTCDLSSTNLLLNPGFHTFDHDYNMPAKWSRWGEGDFFWHGDDSHSGERCMAIGGGGEALVYQVVPFSEAPGKTFQMKVWIKHFTRDGEGNSAQIRLGFRTNAFDLEPMQEAILTVNATREWKEYQLSAKAPEGSAYVSVALLAHRGSKVMFDDVSLDIQGDETVSYDLQQLSHQFLGFGTQLWAYNKNPQNVRHQATRFHALKEMNIKYIRVEHYCDHASWKELKALRRETDQLGIKWVYVIWRSKKESRKMIDSDKGVAQFADEWLQIIHELYRNGIPIEYIELMNEPDSKGDWSTGMDPYWYAKAVMAVREKLNHSPYHQVEIIGPGPSSMKQLHDYIKEMLQNGAHHDLAGWSTHSWGGTETDSEHNYRSGAPSIEYWWEKEFKELSNSKDRALPIYVTEFSSDIRSIDGVQYDPDKFGQWDESKIAPNYSVANTMAFGVRTYENALAFLNKGAHSAFFWQLVDEWPETSDKHKSWGFLDLWGKEKPVYHAVLSLAKNLPPEDAYVLSAPDQKRNNLYTGAFITNEKKLIVGIANTTMDEHSTTITLNNVPGQLRIEEAIAFRQSIRGSPELGIPDQGVFQAPNDLPLHHHQDHSYSLKVTLPPNSVLTIILKI